MACYGKKEIEKEDGNKDWIESGITHSLVPDFVSEDGAISPNVTILFSKFKAFVENYPYNNSYEADNINNYETI